jgi:hypothetical protein
MTSEQIKNNLDGGDLDQKRLRGSGGGCGERDFVRRGDLDGGRQGATRRLGDQFGGLAFDRGFEPG